jgi:hypothetical protein
MYYIDGLTLADLKIPTTWKPGNKIGTMSGIVVSVAGVDQNNNDQNSRDILGFIRKFPNSQLAVGPTRFVVSSWDITGNTKLTTFTSQSPF